MVLESFDHMFEDIILLYIIIFTVVHRSYYLMMISLEVVN
jgi:hypothetical protein